ncbi:MAG: CDF family Co(II)/Ni(II) efflux transporter DmeF [bacterium]|nr:CDF family Co(II)/Ni(II) efflux transporter DmeF [bacterium]
MHQHQIHNWQHDHNYVQPNSRGEQRAKLVLLLTLVTMVAEIIAGIKFHSVALLADGWHMGTHVLAFLITISAYYYAQAHRHDESFSFRAAKVNVLGGFSSSIVLGMVALMMIIECVERLFHPANIQFDQAIFVAVIGLLVNLLSALLLSDHKHSHHHHEDHKEDHHHSHDHNLRAAYLHVLADALTSVTAILALVAGKFWGLNWLDAAMGIVGSIVILSWARGLARETSAILLDRGIDHELQNQIRNRLEDDGECMVSDLHVWPISSTHNAGIIELVTRFPRSPSYYKLKISDLMHIDHLTVEVNCCVGDDCRANVR